MNRYRVAVVFEGLDLSEDPVVDALCGALPESVPAQINGITTVTMDVSATNAEQAVMELVGRVTEAVPTAQALRVDQDLVNINDIAERIGRSRESVRLLADGKRGPGTFPAPIGVVGDGIRVWPWAVVLEWFQSVQDVDVDEVGVLPEAAAVMDACFAARRSLPSMTSQPWPHAPTARGERLWRVPAGGGVPARGTPRLTVAS